MGAAWQRGMRELTQPAAVTWAGSRSPPHPVFSHGWTRQATPPTGPPQGTGCPSAVVKSCLPTTFSTDLLSQEGTRASSQPARVTVWAPFGLHQGLGGLEPQLSRRVHGKRNRRGRQSSSCEPPLSQPWGCREQAWLAPLASLGFHLLWHPSWGPRANKKPRGKPLCHSWAPGPGRPLCPHTLESPECSKYSVQRNRRKCTCPTFPELESFR